MTLLIGSHTSISGSHELAFKRALDNGANTFQIFTGNPRGWFAKEIDEKTEKAFAAGYTKYDIQTVIAHMPYLPNLASPKPDIFEKSCVTLRREVHRCAQLKIPYLVTHLGSHGGEGRDFGIKRVTEAVLRVLDETGAGADGEGSKVMILLENTAGQKNSIGDVFADIAEITENIDAVYKNASGVCFDTCHAFAAGYDLSSEEGFEKTIAEFDDLLGLDRMKVIHLNDAKGVCGGHLDRHEHIGLGGIGEEGIKRILKHPVLSQKPFILETPVDEVRGDKEEIEVVKRLAE